MFEFYVQALLRGRLIFCVSFRGGIVRHRFQEPDSGDEGVALSWGSFYRAFREVQSWQGSTFWFLKLLKLQRTGWRAGQPEPEVGRIDEYA